MPSARALAAARGETIKPTTRAAPSTRWLRAATTALFAAAGAACAAPPNAGPPITFDTARAWVLTDGDSIPLLVEVAATDAQKSRGLQQRDSLDAGSGMIFVYDSLQGPERGFWMWRTLIPLDLAYLDAQGVIVAVRSMEPCESPEPEWCQIPAYQAGLPWQSALEVNLGWLERHGVGVGSRVVLVEEGGGG